MAGLPPEFDLEIYREALVERFGNINFEMLDTTGAYYSGVRLWSVFVPQSVRECREYYPQLLEIPKEYQKLLLEKGEIDASELAETEEMQDVLRREYFRQPIRPVLEVCDDSSIQNIVILGDPGSGKSSLLRYLSLRWSQIENANMRYTQPLPLLIELRDYNRWDCPSGKSFVRYLHEAPTWHRLNQQTLDHLLKQPDRVVLLLDGLDEVFDPVKREYVINDIHRFSNEYKNAKIIVTSRVVGYQAKWLRDAEFCHFMLQDLNAEKISNFLEKWHNVTFDNKEEAERKNERLSKAISDSKPIAMLAGNPLLLTMMAILNRHQELPRDRADLYQQTTRVLLQQWDTERALSDFPGLSSEIGLREKTDILRRVAFAMQSESSGLAGNIIDEQKLANVIEDYLHEELRFAQAKAVTRAVVEQLRVRNFILCFLGAFSYAFIHRTFLEYFCASEFVHRFNVAKTLDEQGMIKLFDEHCRDDEWREVLRLICGQIDEQFVGNIVEYLATRTDLEKWDRKTPLPELTLAIWCLSEVRNTNRIVKAGSKLLSNVIECFLQGSWSSNEFKMELAKASNELGTRWPGKSVFRFSNQLPSSLDWNHCSYWPYFLATVFGQRDWIEQLANCQSYSARRASIGVLAKKWPDERTRKLVIKRVTHEEDPGARGNALKVLAKKWSDKNTRKFLAEYAINDNQPSIRIDMLQALAKKWPDETTRKLLIERTVHDEDENVRRVALKALAQMWPDDATRTLLTECAINDRHCEIRNIALLALAKNWPDKNTRQFLTERAIQDEHVTPRRTAFQLLTENWPDENTLKLLAEIAQIDGAMASLLGGKHSEFGSKVFRKHADNFGPYLDPRESIYRKHIERVAKYVGIAPDQINATVKSLSEHMGWDITKGSKSQSQCFMLYD